MSSITVFTPTFNRAYILDKLYDSLCNQTIKDFIWLIIDDGSSDNTKSLVEKWICENNINIEYIQKENGGKHTAHNKAVEICDTPLFVCVDSDDFLTNDAIEVILDYYKNEDKNVLGFVGRKGVLNFSSSGINWPLTIKYEYFNNIYFSHNYKGETILVFRTEILKKYKYPIFQGEKFVTEAVVYDKLCTTYPLRLISEIIYLAEYMNDGYTNQGNKLKLNNPKGYAYYLKQRSMIVNNYKLKIKYISEYYGWVKINRLNHDDFKTISIPVALGILGKILSHHYIKLYSKLKVGGNC